jgi:hypothetical protein
MTYKLRTDRLLRCSAGALAGIALTFVLLAGCSDRSSTTAPTVSTLRVTPANGATSVRLDAAVVMDFGLTVDRGTIQGGFHLVGEDQMMDPDACPDPSMDHHGTMEHTMADSSRMRHMNEYHSTPGMFRWNEDGTLCTFTPDSLMHSGTRYMIHMDGSMVRHMERMGHGMHDGTMGPTGDLATHFQTMSQDGHGGHH